jgi:hypothetical protein
LILKAIAMVYKRNESFDIFIGTKKPSQIETALVQIFLRDYFSAYSFSKKNAFSPNAGSNSSIQVAFWFWFSQLK